MISPTTHLSALQVHLLALSAFVLTTASAFQVSPPAVPPPPSVSCASRRATDAFLQMTASSSSSSSSSATTPEEMFASAGWEPIKKELDSLPIFCCANEKGQPLQYNVNDETTMPFFYCDVKAAEAELIKAKAELPEDVGQGLGIIPFPLGNAFELMARNRAAIIPSATALQCAGAPAGTNPLGQQVPLFCCMDIMQESPTEGKPVLPIFMVHDEAKAAMEEAVATDGGDIGAFEIVSLSLPRAVELLATNGESMAFHFLPAKDSIDYIHNYLKEDAKSSK